MIWGNSPFCKLILIFIFVFISFAYEITANVFYLDVSNNVLILSHDVRFSRDYYDFNSQQAVVDLKEDKLYVDEDFTINFMKQKVKGYKLVLDNKLSLLTANVLDFNFYKYIVKGRNVKANSKKIEMNDVYITSCKKKKPLFYLNSNKVEVLSEYGVIIAFNSLFYVLDVPIIYLPFYIMGNRRYSIFADKSFIPEIGTNKVEGVYVKQSIPYLLNHSNTGVLQLGYIEKQGLFTGVKHQYLPNDQIKTIMEFYNTPKLKQSSLLVNAALFSYKEGKKKNFIKTMFFALPEEDVPNVYLEYLYQHNKLINEQYVHYYPQLRMYRNYKFNDLIKVYLSYSYANVVENNQLESSKIAYNSVIHTSTRYGLFSINDDLHYIENIYLKDRHRRFWNNFGIGFDVYPYKFNVIWEHTFHYEGQSPFKYDSYQIDNHDKISFLALWDLTMMRLSYKIKKRLLEDYYYSILYEVGLGSIDCIDFRIFWDAIKKEFGFNVTI